MNEYKRLLPCIFIKNRRAVQWFHDDTVINDDVIEIAKQYNDNGADGLIIFDLSDSDREHDLAVDLIRKICRNVRIPVIAGGNVKRAEDVKKYLYAGVKHVILNFSKAGYAELIQDAAMRFGKDKVAVSLNDFDQLFKQHNLIKEYSSEIIFMHRLDLNSVHDITDIPVVVLTDTMEEDEIFRILKASGVNGISGRFISQPSMDYNAFKEKCENEGISMTTYESLMDYSSFKLNSDGLLPVIVQDYRTNEVLMMAYMNEEAFQNTLKTGRMNYYSRSRKSQWLKGETSGHFQYVKSLTIDCDKDTLLAKVDQIGAACHTGNRTCFFQPVAGTDTEELNPLKILRSVYDVVADRKENPKEGSYTNYLFDKGIDKILKKIGEEATELVIAAKNPNPEEIKYELADFLYHAIVLMVERGVTWDDIVLELANR